MVGEALLYNVTVQLGPRNGGGEEVVKLSSLGKHIELDDFCSVTVNLYIYISITKIAPMGEVDGCD